MSPVAAPMIATLPSLKPLLFIVFLASWSACLDEGVYVIPEAQAARIVREVLLERGVDAVATDRRVDDLDVCVEGSPCRTVSLALDGWDDAARVGFAYVSDAERGLPSSTRVERDEAEAIQAQLDERRAEIGLIVVFREWGHETELLAVEGFRRAVQGALDERGLTVSGAP